MLGFEKKWNWILIGMNAKIIFKVIFKGNKSKIFFWFQSISMSINIFLWYEKLFFFNQNEMKFKIKFQVKKKALSNRQWEESFEPLMFEMQRNMWFWTQVNIWKIIEIK
jgi:hypothetical protein